MIADGLPVLPTMRWLVTPTNTENVMPFIPVPKVAQVNVQHTLFEQAVENTLYFLHNTGWDETRLIDLCSAVAGQWATEVMPLFSRDLSFENLRARDLSQQITIAVDYPIIPAVVGSVAVDSLPGNVAYAVKKTTGYAGRNARGRIYFGGLPENVVTGNEVGAGFRATLLSSLNDLKTAIESTLPDVTMVHVSRYLNGLPRIQGAYWHVLSFAADLRVDSQRRRTF